MKLSEIQNKYLEGFKITFDIVNHRNIPNAVFSNKGKIGNASIATITSFNKWRKVMDNYILKTINSSDVLELNSEVIHKSTLELGIYKGECLGFGKCKIDYGQGDYPQPKKNILLIEAYK